MQAATRIGGYAVIGVRLRIGQKLVGFLDFGEDFKPGDPPPADHDYCGWHEWAAVQHKAGLRQSKCSVCGKWRFPQENCCNGAKRYTAAAWRKLEREAKKIVPPKSRRKQK